MLLQVGEVTKEERKLQNALRAAFLYWGLRNDSRRE